MLRILAVGLLLAHSLSRDLGRIADPQFDLQLRQQTFEPTGVPAGFHPHSHRHATLLQFAIKPLHLAAAVLQSPLAAFPALGRRTMLFAAYSGGNHIL